MWLRSVAWEDYPEDDGKESGMLDVFEEIYGPLEEYEEELEKDGVLPDAPSLDNQNGEFLRVHFKAEEGDERAIDLLSKMEEFENS